MIDFTDDELNMVYEDQRSSLENVHAGDECNNLSICPNTHFGSNEDIEEIFMRQDIMKKILTDANERG